MAQPPKPMSLSEFIRSTSDELAKARTESDKAIMQLEKCELELEIKVTAEAGGGFKFWIAEASGKVAGERTNTIKVSFVPLTGNPAPTYKTAPADESAHQDVKD